MDVSWGRVRQVVLNDRVNGYKPDKRCLAMLSSYIPDVRVIGFGKYYEHHWYLIIESKYFTDSIEPIESRGAIPLTGILKQIREFRGRNQQVIPGT